MSIKLKILVFSLLSVLLPFSVLGWFSYDYSIRTNQDRYVLELQGLGRLVAAGVERQLEQVRADLQAFAATPLLQRPADRDAARIDAYFAALQERFPQYHGFALVVAEDPGAHDPERDRMPAAIAVPASGPAELHVGIAVPAAPAADRLRVAVSLDALRPALLRAAGRRVTLASGERRLLDASGVLDPPGPVQTGAGQPAPGFGQATFYRDHEGTPVLGVRIAIPVEGLSVLVEVDSAAVFADLAGLKTRVLLLLAVVLALLLIAGHYFGRSLVRPINRLTEGAGRVAEGDLALDLASDRSDEIGYLSRVFDDMVGRLRESRRVVSRAQAQLEAQNRRLEALTTTDALTGLANRRSLNDTLRHQLERFRRNGRRFCVLMLDLDHFKRINDGHGHLVGDEVLRRFAQCLIGSIRTVDSAARYGGEEFTVVLFETGRDNAMESAQRIRKAVEQLAVPQLPGLTISVSIGLAEVCDTDEQPDTLLQRADAALYQAKQTGRNRVCVAAGADAAGHSIGNA